MEEHRSDVQEYAADLRRLRLEAGSPTLSRLQSETGISRSVLSDALAGKYLPSARTVDALVRALKGDSLEWISRRDVLADQRDAEKKTSDADDAPTDADEQPPPAITSMPRSIRMRTVALLTAGAFVLGVAVTAVVASVVTSSIVVAGARADATSQPRISVATGEDPAFTDCIDDAEVAAAATGQDGTLLEILWSDTCYAGWGRVTRYDGKASANTVSVAIYPETAPDGPERQEATEHGVRSAYTMLVVRPTPDTLLCAVGAFSADGKNIDLGEPVCT